jgi:phosphate transport system substrate-binding protein
MDQGVCTNLPSRCSVAASKELIAMTSPYVTCPECGSRPQRVKGGRAPAGPGASARAPGSELGSVPQIPRNALIAGGGLLLVLLLGFLGWQFLGSSPRIAAASGGAGGEYAIRLSGSNTIGKALAPDLVKAWLESKGASDVVSEARVVAGKDAPESVIRGTVDGRSMVIEVRPHGSSTAFSDMADGTADIGMASRAVKSAEVDKLKALGDIKAVGSEHVVGLDGVAVIVNAENPIGALSTATLRRIFMGELKNWAEVGGRAQPITLYARDDKSGTFDTFKELVLRGKSMSDAKRFEDSAELESAVAKDSAAIGFVGLPYVKTAKALAVNDGDGAPLEPTSFSIRTESYPLSRRLYFYSRPGATNSDVADFVAFALSPAGQAVVRKDRFVDLDIAAAAAAGPVQSNAPCQLSAGWGGDRNAYCNLRRASEALPTTFRFRAGSDILDTRASADLRRVLARMEQTPNKQIVLAGFSDNLGKVAGNCALSLSRGKRVAAALATLGLSAREVIGFCSELPVRDNSTPEGRDQNRRVEIFLR